VGWPIAGRVPRCLVFPGRSRDVTLKSRGIVNPKLLVLGIAALAALGAVVGTVFAQDPDANAKKPAAGASEVIAARGKEVFDKKMRRPKLRTLLFRSSGSLRVVYVPL